MVSLNPFTALSDAQVEQFDQGAEDLLERTGFCVQHDALRARARAQGAHVDDADGRVRFPKPLLRELLGRTPPTYTIRNAAGGGREIGGGADPGVFAITNDPWIIDYDTGQPRHPSLDDVVRHTILGQQIESVVCMSCMDYPVVECADATSSWRALEAHLLHHAKHWAVLAASPEKLEDCLAIARVLNRGQDPAGSRLMTCGVAVRSPLTLTGPNGELLLAACAHDFPVVPTICPMAGTTAPYSLASTLLLAHAENLFMAALTQLIRPGNPFQYGLGPSVSDMRTAHDRYYTLDKVLWKVAGAQLAKAHNMPCGAECGGAMTHRCDVQTGAEGMLFMLAAYASGADLLCGLGSCYNANGMSAEMMVIQEAWLDAARFLTNGINTAPTRLGLDNIAEAEPGGEFLTDPLTLELCRGGEFFDNALFDYTGHAGDAPSMLERAHERVEELLAGYECPVPHDIREGLARHFHDFYRQHRL